MVRRFLILLLYCAAASNLALGQIPSETDGWISLFDGRSLKDWMASEHPHSFKVVDGQIVAEGPRAHLFYIGRQLKADFKNFELTADVMTRPGANSGVYFHTQYEQGGWPSKGFEVQINNTYKGDADYRELKKPAAFMA